MKILVVDDSGFEQVRIRALLEGLGHEVVLASNGVDALESYAATQPDLILLDVMMPVMDGLEAARRIRALPVPWTPIIFLSSNVEPEDIASGIEAGGDDYLSKPVNCVVLKAKLLAMQRISAMQTLMAKTPSNEFKDEIADLVEVDRLSGFATERAGKGVLTREFVRCSRTVQSVSLIVVGIDRFAALVETQGEVVAQRCLKSLVVALQSNASRMTDFISRYGESAFAVVMPDTPMTGAVRVAERIRCTIAELDSPTEMVPVRFSVSAGVATVIPQRNGDSQHLESAADGMLQQAFQEGGNRVHAAAADVPFRLTARELECLQWSAIGKSSWEISTILSISESAVNFHMANIRSKFDVSSRRQAVVQAIRFGLIRAA
jgi:diguanylate cyclase (GGDEF)-like protein